MNLEIPLTNDMESALHARASAAGRDVRSFVVEAIMEKLADSEHESVSVARNSEDWSARLRQCIDLHPVVTHFVDDSREFIYRGRGE